MGIYDLGGGLYDAFHLSVTFGREERLKRDAIASLDLQPGQRVLDWGCGTGLSLKWLSHHLRDGGTIYAVDAAPAMTQRAVRRTKPTEQLQYHFILRDGLSLKLPEPVDAAVASYSLGVLDPSIYDTAVRSLWENIAEGGKLLVLDMYVPEYRRPLARLYQKLTMVGAHWLFRQDFSETLLPVVEQYFEPLDVQRIPSQMAVTFLGRRRPEPLESAEVTSQESAIDLAGSLAQQSTKPAAKKRASRVAR